MRIILSQTRYLLKIHYENSLTEYASISGGGPVEDAIQFYNYMKAEEYRNKVKLESQITISHFTIQEINISWTIAEQTQIK